MMWLLSSYLIKGLDIYFKSRKIHDDILHGIESTAKEKYICIVELVCFRKFFFVWNGFRVSYSRSKEHVWYLRSENNLGRFNFLCFKRFTLCEDLRSENVTHSFVEVIVWQLFRLRFGAWKHVSILSSALKNKILQVSIHGWRQFGVWTKLTKLSMSYQPTLAGSEQKLKKSVKAKVLFHSIFSKSEEQEWTLKKCFKP